MNCVINGLHIEPGATGGAETYLLGLLSGLTEVQSNHQFTVLVWKGVTEELNLSSNNSIQFEEVSSNLFQRLRRGVLRAIARPHPTGWLANVGADVIHFPNAVAMLRPFRISSPIVLTMTDIQHEYHPEHWPSDDIRLRRRVFPKSVERARAVIAISRFTKIGLIETYKTPPDKVHVIYPGVDFNSFSKPLSEDQAQNLKRRYDLPKKYLLYPAGTWPHKNHLRLLRAFKNFLANESVDLHLILTGIEQVNHDRVLQAIRELEVEDHVRHLGHVPHADLPGLFKQSEGLVFPSLFEGFGLPIVEAMAATVPVLCSNLEVFQEIADDIPLYFDPRSVDDITKAIRRLILDREYTAERIEAGRSHASNFTWERCASETIRVYESVL